VPASLAAIAASGCDQGHQDDQPTTSGPFVTFLGSNVAVHGLVNADDAGPNAPASTVVIQLAFDRVLNPATVNRQSFVLLDANKNPVSVGPVITYDPIARVVRMEAPMGGGWIGAGQVYYIELGIPAAGALSGGVRAFDGATLDPGLPDTARIVDFQTCPAAGCADGAVVAADPPDPTPPDFCRDVLPIFSQHCSGGVCHGSISGSQLPAEGLILDSYAGVVNTAINRSSEESNTGPLSGVSGTTGTFGLDMKIIDPGSAATSWLIYKMLLAPTRTLAPDGGDPSPSVRFLCADGGLGDLPVNPFQSSDGGATLPASAAPFTIISDGERALLDDYVLGQQMPYPNSPGLSQAGVDPNLLSFDEMERIQTWISSGAQTQDCGSCQP
jgi:hypothetical protein